MVWEDVKKLGGLIFEQTKEQKNIVLLKLQEVSYNNKKEDAFARLGQATFKLVDSGEGAISSENQDVSRIVNEIKDIDIEILKIDELIESLKNQAAGERDTMASEVSNVWEKTKTAFGSDEDETVEVNERDIEKKPVAKKAAKAPVAKKAKVKAKKSAPSSKDSKKV